MECTPKPLALRAREAAKLLNICQKTLWFWTKSGIVPHVRVGRAVLYPVDQLQEWLREQAVRQQAAAAEQEGQGDDNSQ